MFVDPKMFTFCESSIKGAI